MTQPAQSPILPTRQGEERPLFMILTIMAFFAGLTVIISLAGLRLAQSWQDELGQSATVQIYTQDEAAQDEPLARALDILRSVDGIKRAQPMTRQDSEALLKPWLGDMELPDDLPLPILIRIDKLGDGPLDTQLIKQRLQEANIDANIDDHRQWSASLSRGWTQLRLGLTALLGLILLATASIVNFATQSALTSRRQIITVLQQVGASRVFISWLFVRRFFVLGLKAACLGVLLAVIFAAVIWAGQNVTSDNSVNMYWQAGDMVYMIALCVIIGIIVALTAGIMSRRILDKGQFD